jgi:hypothetical protein
MRPGLFFLILAVIKRCHFGLLKEEAILGTVANLINKRGNQLFETQLNDFWFS